jgi:hypothetical protein
MRLYPREYDRCAGWRGLLRRWKDHRVPEGAMHQSDAQLFAEATVGDLQVIEQLVEQRGTFRGTLAIGLVETEWTCGHVASVRLEGAGYLFPDVLVEHGVEFAARGLVDFDRRGGLGDVVLLALVGRDQDIGDRRCVFHVRRGAAVASDGEEGSRQDGDRGPRKHLGLLGGGFSGDR